MHFKVLNYWDYQGGGGNNRVKIKQKQEQKTEIEKRERRGKEVDQLLFCCFDNTP